MSTIQQQIELLDKKIAEAERDLNRFEGQIESEKVRLKELGVELEKASEVLSTMNTQLTKLQQETEETLKQIKEGYKW